MAQTQARGPQQHRLDEVQHVGGQQRHSFHSIVLEAQQPAETHQEVPVVVSIITCTLVHRGTISNDRLCRATRLLLLLLLLLSSIIRTLVHRAPFSDHRLLHHLLDNETDG